MAGEDSEPQDGRQEFRVAVRLLPREYSLLIIESILNDVTVGDLLRDAYFGGLPTGSGQAMDD